MRPIDRGEPPIDAAGAPFVFAEYQHARSDLIGRLGRYCSFCERWIPSSLAVEHVAPKSLNPHLEREWSNFLLACSNCNSTKGDKPVDREVVLLPDQDDTYRGLRYGEAGRIAPSPDLPEDALPKARALVDLVGLDRAPGGRRPEPTDFRWLDRQEAWTLARRYRKQWDEGAASIGILLDLCRERGHFSIWMTVFAGCPTVEQALVESFPGTRRVYFPVVAAPPSDAPPPVGGEFGDGGVVDPPGGSV